MRVKNSFATWVTGCATLGLLVGLGACGGGGGSGGGAGGLPEFVALAGLRMGNLSAGTENAVPYPTLPVTGVPVPPGGSITVQGAVFPSGTPGTQDYIELTLNVPVEAATVLGSGFGTGGVTIFTIASGVATAVPITLDEFGVINPANAFPSPGVAPALLRLYYDPDGDLTTPDILPPGDYTLSINENLKSLSGGPFCTNIGSPNCVNDYLPTFSFTIGDNDTTPLEVSTTAPSTPVTGDPLVPINKEIVLNFAEAVDFPSLVGAANLTTLDPFITIPRPFTEPGCQSGNPVPAFTTAGHLVLAYTPPTDPVSSVQQSLPAGLGFIVYMPDPILNPTQVRIRIVQTLGLSGIQGNGATQNYASNPRKLPIPGANGPLPLPPLTVVPGSLQGYLGATGDTRAATVDVFVMSSAFAPVPPLPGPPDDTCYAATTGALDRSGNPLAVDFQLTFAYDVGLPQTSNPQPPDATFVLRKSGGRGLSVINTTPGTTEVGAPGSNTQAPITYGTSITGTMQVAPNRLDNQFVLGSPLDLEIGAWINTTATATNNVTNPPRGSQNIPGVPDDPNGTTPLGLLDVIGIPTGPPVQPYGNFLYVVDGDANEVKVLDGYSWTPITTLTGIASPRGLGISPDLSFLYISNFGQGTVTRVFANPAAPTLHTVANLINVGAGPTAIAVQPQNKDVFVTEFIANSYSRVSVTTQAVRKSLTTGLGPNEVVVGMEMLGTGLTNAYLAYVFNFFDDSVTVFEEDSPAAPENAPDGKEVHRQTGFDGPSRGAWNWQSYIAGTFEPGCFVANTQGSSVDEMSMQTFVLGPPPGIQGQPAERRFHIAKSYNGLLVGSGTASPTDVSIDAHSGLYNAFIVGTTNNKGIADPLFNQSGGVPSLVLVSFPGEGLVGIYDYNSPALFGTVSVPGCDELVGYYDQ